MRMLLFCCLVSSIQAHFFNEKARGWYWYEKKPDVPKKEKPDQKADPSKERRSATELLAEHRKEVEEALANSILTPTRANIETYQKLQHKWVALSERFSNVWMRNLLDHPELDATVQNPTSQYGVSLKKELDQTRMEESVRALSSQYGLFFIYQGRCKFCKGMALVVRLLSEKYGWKVLGISQDGVILPEFPDSKQDNGISSAWGIKGVPAVFVVNPESETVTPIGHGMISLEQLEKNLILQIKDRL